jgi:hypothetical protein
MMVEILVALTLKVAATDLWDLMCCSSLDRCRKLEEPAACLHGRTDCHRGEMVCVGREQVAGTGAGDKPVDIV